MQELPPPPSLFRTWLLVCWLNICLCQCGCFSNVWSDQGIGAYTKNWAWPCTYVLTLEKGIMWGGIRSIYRVEYPVCSSPPWPALWLQTNIVQTIINSLSVFTDFGQHSRWISPDNIDYYKSCRMVSISKSSFWFPYPFSISVSQYGFNFDFARGSTCRLSHNRQRARQTTSG